MPQIVTQPKVIHQHLTTQTSQGEVTINLNLTITINTDGTVSVGAQAQERPPIKDIPDSIYTIPNFDTEEILNNFGEN